MRGLIHELGANFRVATPASPFSNDGRDVSSLQSAGDDFRLKLASPVRIRDAYEFIVTLIVDRIEMDMKWKSTFNDPDPAVIGEIHALRVMIQAHLPRCVDYHFNREMLNAWRKKVSSHLDKHQKQIPLKHRVGFVQSINEDFDFLEQALGDSPKIKAKR